MKIILSAAISANGMITDENGSEDFLSHKNWLTFAKLANKIGNNIYGRKTYEAVKSWNGDYLDEIKDVTKVIISTDQSPKHESSFKFVSSPENAISLLTDLGFKEALVTGGSSVYSYYLSHNLVDEIILDINPVILPKGKALFDFEGKQIKLELLETTPIGDGIVEFHYKVIK